MSCKEHKKKRSAETLNEVIKLVENCIKRSLKEIEKENIRRDIKNAELYNTGNVEHLKEFGIDVELIEEDDKNVE